MNKNSLVVRQSYHGAGGSDGYKWEVWQFDEVVGYLKDFPSSINYDTVCQIDGVFYIVTDIHDGTSEQDIIDEVSWFTLERWTYTPDVVLEYDN